MGQVILFLFFEKHTFELYRYLFIKKYKAMKKMLLSILTILLLIPFNDTEAQQLVQEGSVWNIGVIGWFNPPSTYSLKLEGDTTISNIDYKKMYISYDSANTQWLQIENYLREDSLNRVYHKDAYGDEQLLYDFNYELGDTVPYWCDVIVTAIDTIYLENNEPRRRMRLESEVVSGWLTTYHWIDGIGSTAGLLTPMGSHCTTDHLEFLQCYYYDSELSYPLEEICFTVTPTEEISQSDEIKVYPNPTSGILAIESLRSDWTVENIQLFSPLGEQVRTIEKQGELNQFDISELPNGMYYLILQLNTDQRISKRITKVN